MDTLDLYLRSTAISSDACSEASSEKTDTNEAKLAWIYLARKLGETSRKNDYGYFIYFLYIKNVKNITKWVNTIFRSSYDSKFR